MSGSCPREAEREQDDVFFGDLPVVAKAARPAFLKRTLGRSVMHPIHVVIDIAITQSIRVER